MPLTSYFSVRLPEVEKKPRVMVVPCTTQAKRTRILSVGDRWLRTQQLLRQLTHQVIAAK